MVEKSPHLRNPGDEVVNNLLFRPLYGYLKHTLKSSIHFCLLDVTKPRAKELVLKVADQNSDWEGLAMVRATLKNVWNLRPPDDQKHHS